MAADSGSVFVDAVVATAIIALATGATFEVAGAVSRRQGQLDDRREALLVARSELAAVGAEIPLAIGRSEGLAGDYLWRVDVAPYEGEQADSQAGDLRKVSVTVSRRKDMQALVRLSTLRLSGGGE